MAGPAPAAPGYSFGQKGSSGSAVAPAPTIMVTVPAATAGPSVQYGAESSLDQSSLPTDRMVVRTGSMQMVVNDISSVMDSISKIAANYGGYVVTSQRGKEGERNIGNISIRILAENYDKATADLRALAKSVTSESTSSQDVTEEYVDLDSKVKNLEATESQLLKIMQTATKTEDILSIQRELTNVRGEIDQAKGRMQYLQRTSSTSLIQIRLEEAVLALKFSADKVSAGTEESIRFTSEVIGGFAPYNYLWDFGDGNTSTEASPSHSYKNAGTYNVFLKVTDDKGYTNTLARNAYISIVQSWKPSSVASDAWNGFTAFGRGFVNFLIYVGIFSPIWIVIGGVVGIILYRRKKK
jgi:PKD repeat protein